MKNELKKFCKAIFCGITICAVFFFIIDHGAYRPETPPFIGSMVEPFKGEGVFVLAKAYSAYESQTYLSRNLLQKGFQPVQVTIQNNTAATYYLSKEGVDAEHASSGQVAFHVSKSAIPRSIAFKIVSFFFWPFMIPGTIDTIYTFKSHFKMKNDYYAKSIKERKEALIPYSTVHRVIFIPNKKYSEDLTLFLQDAKTGKFYPFSIKINS